MLDVVSTLQDLVRIPSVNPMGQDACGDEYFEWQLTDYLEALFRRLQLPFIRQPVAPRRDNIIARLEGPIPPQRNGPLVLWEVHQDTVPVEGMRIQPWQAEVRDGRLYGRGACDVKGSMACMLTALARLADERPAQLPTIALACSVNEECGFTGARRLPQLWSNAGSSFLPRRPDAAIVAEPTGLNVVVAHKGVLRWKCHTTGRAAHSSTPELGDNAIYRMSHVVQGLEHYAAKVLPDVGKDALLGQATLSVGTISGGVSANTVPDRCTVDIDRRLLPDEAPEAAYDHAVRFVAQWCAPEAAPEHEAPYLFAGGLAHGGNGHLADQVQTLVRQTGVSSQQIGVAYATDATALAADGVPTVVIGPGSIQQAHTADEWIALDQLHQGVEVFYRLGKTPAASCGR